MTSFRQVAWTLAVVIAAPALAAEEPTGIWGLEFGRPLAEQLPECTGKPGVGGLPSYDFPQNRRCFERSHFSKSQLTLQANPDLGFPASGSALLVDGRVEGVIVFFKRLQRAKAEELLVARFGPPTSSSSRAFVTGAGARVSGQIHVWILGGVNITYTEYAGSIDQGAFRVSTSALRESDQREAESRAQKHKGNL